MSTDTNKPESNPGKPAVHFGPHAEEGLKLYAKEIATYLRELPRLLDEGGRGKHALIKGDEILSVWDTEGDAMQASREKSGLAPILVKQIDERDIKRCGLVVESPPPIVESQISPTKSSVTREEPKIVLDQKGREVIKLFEKEIATLARELPRLVAEGQEGRHALVKGDEILSIWDTFGDALQMGREKFGLDPICVHRLRAREIPLLVQLIELGKESSCQ